MIEEVMNCLGNNETHGIYITYVVEKESVNTVDRVLNSISILDEKIMYFCDIYRADRHSSKIISKTVDQFLTFVFFWMA